MTDLMLCWLWVASAILLFTLLSYFSRKRKDSLWKCLNETGGIFGLVVGSVVYWGTTGFEGSASPGKMLIESLHAINFTERNAYIAGAVAYLGLKLVALIALAISAFCLPAFTYVSLSPRQRTPAGKSGVATTIVACLTIVWILVGFNDDSNAGGAASYGKWFDNIIGLVLIAFFIVWRKVVREKGNASIPSSADNPSPPKE
jgi:hypothetical protein